MKKIILTLLLAFAFTANAEAQDDKTVTLVVSGQGKTQDEAKQNALRSAIEQAFGAFISSKTEILNDSLVKDEIVSVANGNIQKYEIISEIKLSENQYAITLKGIVSISKLSAFAESKGVTVDFKGDLLAVNIKQQILNEENEIISINNICNNGKIILKQSCDFELGRGKPKQFEKDNSKWAIPLAIGVKFNKNIVNFNSYLLNSIKTLSLSESDEIQYKNLGKNVFKIVMGIGNDSLYGVTDNIDFLRKNCRSNKNMMYLINCDEKNLFKSNDINAAIKEYKKYMRNTRDYGTCRHIRYFDTTEKLIFSFRRKESIDAIVDLIISTKQAYQNYNIISAVDTFNHSEIFTNRKNNNLELIAHRFYGLYYFGEPYFPDDFDLQMRQDLFTDIYKKGSRYSLAYPYNFTTFDFALLSGKKEKDIDDRHEFASFHYKNNILPKYNFLIRIESECIRKPLHEIAVRNYGNYSPFDAVISLSDFQCNNKYLIIYRFNDILSVDQLGLVNGYSILANK